MKNLLKKDFPKDTKKLLVILMCLATFINLIIECFNRASLFKGVGHAFSSPLVFFYNAFVIFITLSLALLFKRRFFFIVLTSVIWIGFGITNFVILCNRVTPFTGTDFSMLSDGTTILTKYFNGWQIVLVVAAAILLVIGLVILWKRAPIYKSKVTYIRNSIVIVVITIVVIITTQIAISTNVLAANFGNLADAYKDYGFVYCFVNSIVNTGMNKPDEYSPNTMDKITVDTLGSKKNTDEAKKPNIIMVQLESLFDPTTLKGVEFSKDPIPNIHKLSDEFTSGVLTVPSIGAGTANTEFETITGMNLDFFGPGEYPYKTILKETTAESLAYNLKDLGYGTHALHNNDGTFYGRNQVFANLGFDTFTSLEYMNPITETPTGWAKDEILIKEIVNTLKSTKEQDYVYAISVQGHGKYPNNPVGDLQSGETSDEVTNAATEEALKETPATNTTTEEASPLEEAKPSKEELLLEYSSSPDYIKVDGFDEEKDYAFEYYVNQLHEMDQFVADLIAAVAKLDEEVVLVFFGDHLPTFGIEEEDLEVNTLFDTPYVVWDNLGLPKKDKNLEAYQLNAHILEQLNIDHGTLTKLHQNKDKAEDYLETFELLQYDMLYGKKSVYGEVNPFEPTDIQMGIYDEKLIDVIEEEDRILITGQFFTPYSQVIINDDIIDTVYISPNEVSIEKIKLDQGDIITVGQVDGSYVLSETNEYIYTTVVE